MSIVKKLDQILTHIDGVLSADREQNVKILIRQIKDELASNNDKTMADLLNVIKPKKYVIFYYNVAGEKFYFSNYSGSHRNINYACAYDSIESVSNAINKFSKIYPFQFKIEQVKPSIGFSDFNDFHENC